MKFNRKNVRKALEDLADKAHDAIGHVGAANYAERPLEADAWVEKKRDELIAALCPDKSAPKVERDVFKDPRCEPDKGLNGGDVIVHPHGDTKRVLNVHGHEVYYDYRIGSQDNKTFITSVTRAEWAKLADEGWTVISRAESK